MHAVSRKLDQATAPRWRLPRPVRLVYGTCVPVYLVVALVIHESRAECSPVSDARSRAAVGNCRCRRRAAEEETRGGGSPREEQIRRRSFTVRRARARAPRSTSSLTRVVVVAPLQLERNVRPTHPRTQTRRVCGADCGIGHGVRDAQQFAGLART